MEERKEEGEAEIQEHGPEHWFSKWERQCLAEAEQDEQLPPELQEEAAAAAQPEHKQQKLWHLFQNSATAVAQLYKGEGSRRRRHLAPLRGWPSVGGGTAPGSGASAVVPRPRRPLPARWRRGRRALGRGSGWGGGWGPAWGRVGGAPGLRDAPPAGLRLGGPLPASEAGSLAPPRGRGGRGRSPRSQNGEGRRPRGPIVPQPASGRGLRGAASLRRASALGCAPPSPSAPSSGGSPGRPAADPLFSSGPPPRAGSRNLNKMAKPNMAVPE